MTVEGREFIAVVDWEKLQYHKQLTNPPWTRLHQDWLTDYRFSKLTLPQRGVLFCMHMLAARTGNRIPNDVSWIAGQVGCKSSSVSKVILNLTSTGFLRVFADTPDAKEINKLTFISDAATAPPDGEQNQIKIQKEEGDGERPSSLRHKKGDSFDDIKVEVLAAAKQAGTNNADFVWREYRSTLKVCNTRKQFDAAWSQLGDDGELPTGRSTQDLADEFGLHRDAAEDDDSFRKRVLAQEMKRRYPNLSGGRAQ